MFENLTDVQISALYDVLNDAVDKHHHYPDETPAEERAATGEMYSAVVAEARRRRLF